MNVVQACATALILAMDPNLQDTQIAEWARDAVFKYGTQIPSTQNQFHAMQRVQSPSSYGNMKL